MKKPEGNVGACLGRTARASCSCSSLKVIPRALAPFSFQMDGAAPPAADIEHAVAGLRQSFLAIWRFFASCASSRLSVPFSK